MEFLADILNEFWGVLGEMAPYLLFGFLVAGLLSVFISQKTVERNLGKPGISSVAKASLFGIPLPLCSCGVIPVGASLRRNGASKGATTSFLLSTPQTGVDSILVTYSLLGPFFAVYRPIVAFVSGLLGGALVEVFDKNGSRFNGDIEDPCGDSCGIPEQRTGNKLAQAFKYGFVSLPQDIGKALIVGLVIAALISYIIPDDFFTGLFGTGIASMVVMMVVGIPLYVCATASVPIAAAFMAKGISAGAALVFLMTGPATNAATISTIWKVLGKKTAFLYLLTVVISSLAAGFLLNYIYTSESIPSMPHAHQMVPGILENSSAVVLILILSYALIQPYFRSRTTRKAFEMSDAQELNIKGMTCNHCAANVQRVIEECPGVDEVTVDLTAGKAFIKGEGFDLKCAIEAVTKIGYSVA
ncbi:SO_0444 family Cu/Zn efflux transporter [bacterium]|nr:SO_0444 family Cu/Zn efflux transporter [bacterium]MBU1651383.1 SO_0444 family Cu/Zn efflux transporter [bacterium]